MTKSNKFSLEDLFKGDKVSIDIVRLIVNRMSVKKAKITCSINQYMNKKVCNDSFWLQYYENMFLGPKPSQFKDRDHEKLQIEITDLFFYLLKHKKVKYAIIIYKKYKKYIDIARKKNKAIRLSSKNGYIELVKLLLNDNRVNPDDDGGYIFEHSDDYSIIPYLFQYPIILASRNNHADIVKLLLKDKRSDPAANNNQAINLASELGYVDIVKLLLQDKRVNPAGASGWNTAIQGAAAEGHVDIVKLLLNDPRVDPTAGDNYSFTIASQNGHVDIVKLLLNDPRVRNSLSKADLKKVSSKKTKEEFKEIKQ